MIAPLVRVQLARSGPMAPVLVLLLSIPGAFSPALAIIPLLVIVWRVLPPRLSAFEAALPVRGREVVMARVIATLALMLLPISIWATVALFDLRPNDPGLQLLALTSLGVAGLLLPYHVNRGSLRSAPPGRHLVAWGALAAVGGAISFLLPPAPAAWLLALGVVASVAGLWISIPDALQLAPASATLDDASPDVPAREEERDTPGIGARWWLGALRAMIPWRVAVFYPLLALAAVTDSALFFFCVVVLLAHTTIRARTRWLAALPLMHRTRLLAVVVPSVVVSTCCVGLGTVLPVPVLRYRNMLTRDAPSTTTAGRYYSSPTAVSIDHWRRVEGTAAPVITAPWGERVVADTASLLGITLYNPYTSLEHSSREFVAWQFERLTAEVYRRPLTQAQYDTMSVYPPRYDGGPRGWLVSTAALLILGLLIALLSELAWSYRVRTGSAMARATPWLVAMPGTLLVAAEFLLRVRGTDAAMPLLHGALRTVAYELPTNPVAALVVAAVPVALMYALLEWQFNRSDSALVAKASNTLPS